MCGKWRHGMEINCWVSSWKAKAAKHSVHVYHSNELCASGNGAVLYINEAVASHGSVAAFRIGDELMQMPRDKPSRI
jgi:hypothetical protein